MGNMKGLSILALYLSLVSLLLSHQTASAVCGSEGKMNLYPLFSMFQYFSHLLLCRAYLKQQNQS